MKFKSLKKLYEYFEKRLNNLVNNTSDRVRLPCPYSRVSELILLDRCISLRKKNAVKKLDTLYQRQLILKQLLRDKEENLLVEKFEMQKFYTKVKFIF